MGRTEGEKNTLGIIVDIPDGGGNVNVLCDGQV